MTQLTFFFVLNIGIRLRLYQSHTFILSLKDLPEEIVNKQQVIFTK